MVPLSITHPTQDLSIVLSFSVGLAFLSKAIVCVSEYADMWTVCKLTRPPIDFLVSVGKTS